MSIADAKSHKRVVDVNRRMSVAPTPLRHLTGGDILRHARSAGVVADWTKSWAERSCRAAKRSSPEPPEIYRSITRQALLLYFTRAREPRGCVAMRQLSTRDQLAIVAGLRFRERWKR